MSAAPARPRTVTARARRPIRAASARPCRAREPRNAGRSANAQGAHPWARLPRGAAARVRGGRVAARRQAAAGAVAPGRGGGAERCAGQAQKIGRRAAGNTGGRDREDHARPARVPCESGAGPTDNSPGRALRRAAPFRRTSGQIKDGPAAARRMPDFVARVPQGSRQERGRGSGKADLGGAPRPRSARARGALTSHARAYGVTHPLVTGAKTTSLNRIHACGAGVADLARPRV